jgi:hypothetical protein
VVGVDEVVCARVPESERVRELVRRARLGRKDVLDDGVPVATSWATVRFSSHARTCSPDSSKESKGDSLVERLHEHAAVR